MFWNSVQYLAKALHAIQLVIPNSDEDTNFGYEITYQLLQREFVAANPQNEHYAKCYIKILHLGENEGTAIYLVFKIAACQKAFT